MDFRETADHACPPTPDQLEVSLFGPGFGECVVVHLGGGRWLIVDSCRNPATRRPVALDYLAALGVDVASQVQLVVASHWHDDHIEGLSDVLAAATSARLVLSVAVRTQELMKLVAYGARHVSSTHSSGVDELRYCLSELARRAGPARTPVFAIAQRELPVQAGDAAAPASLRCLSPSDAAVQRCLVAFARLLPEVGRHAPRSIPNPRPNETAVVLWLSLGDRHALLGSDLEETGRADSGWSTIVGSHTAGRAFAYKVAHHGSCNAELGAIWTDLLVPAPIVMLTPFLRGQRPLPAPGDLERLLDRATEVFLSRPPKHLLEPPPRAAAVERTMREVTRARRTLAPKMGQVRVRTWADSTRAPVVECFGAAHALRRRI